MFNNNEKCLWVNQQGSCFRTDYLIDPVASGFRWLATMISEGDMVCKNECEYDSSKIDASYFAGIITWTLPKEFDVNI